MALRGTLLTYVAIASQLVPPAVAVAGGRLVTTPRRWTVLWCLMLAAHDAVAGVVALWGPNLWVGYFFRPLTGSVALYALSCWQAGATARATLRIAIPLFVAGSIALTLSVEDPRAFSLYAGPYLALVLTAAAAWAFVRRSQIEADSPVRQDWFWAVGGMLLYYGTYTALQPVSAYLLQAGREDLIHAVYNLKAAVDVLAFGAISGAMVCPVPPTFSGGPSSPPFSPSPPSSEPSASRW